MELKNIKVGAKLFSSFAIVIAVFVLVALFQLWMSSDMHDIEEEGSKRTHDLMELEHIEILTGKFLIRVNSRIDKSNNICRYLAIDLKSTRI